MTRPWVALRRSPGYDDGQPIRNRLRRLALASQGADVVMTRLSRVLVLACLATISATAQAADPFIGTWTLNVSKSNTAFKSGRTVVEADGDGIRTTADMVRADGTAYHFRWTAKYDGK